MIRNLIFDWSGTLVDDLPAVWKASNEVFRQAGVPELTLEQFRAEFCLPFQLFYDRFVPHLSLAQVETWFHQCFRENQDGVQALPHARDFLEFCRRNQLRCFVLTTVRTDHFQRQIQNTEFAPFFESTYAGVMDKRRQIGEMLALHHLRAAETLFVGDMQHDIETARHGGVHSCAVLTGYNRLDQLRAAQPEVIVEHLGELQQLLVDNRLVWPPASTPSLPALNGQPVATVGALIFNPSGRFLMVRTRKWSDLWGIPGGKVKFGEPSEAALRREIKEETGLDVDRIRFELVQDCIHSPEFYRDAHFILLNYTCHCQGEPTVVLNDEAQEFRWVSWDETAELSLNQPTVVLLRHVAGRTEESGHV